MLIGPARRAAHLATLALAVFVAACGLSELPAPKEAQTLVVAVRPGPASWFPGADGTPQGLDHDLIARFAREQDKLAQQAFAAQTLEGAKPQSQ